MITFCGIGAGGEDCLDNADKPGDFRAFAPAAAAFFSRFCWLARSAGATGYSAFDGFPAFFDITLFFQLKSQSGRLKTRSKLNLRAHSVSASLSRIKQTPVKSFDFFNRPPRMRARLAGDREFVCKGGVNSSRATGPRGRSGRRNPRPGGPCRSTERAAISRSWFRVAQLPPCSHIATRIHKTPSR